MKLVTFEVATVLGRFERLGAILGQSEYILDLHAATTWWLTQRGHGVAERVASAMVPPNMRGFIEAGQASLELAREIVDFVNAEWNAQEALRFKGIQGENLLFHLSNIKLKAPLPNPNSLRDFLTFEAHIKRGYEIRGGTVPPQWYDMPVYYKGNHRSILGPNDPVTWPDFTKKLDYELEWACIIGKSGQNIAEADAASYIFGYTILNDWSARDIQMEEMKCRLGPAKGKDFATSIGPVIVTADEIPDPRNLRMTAKINGELWSEGNTGTSYWTWEQVIAHVSQDETLYPSDLLGSGTVGGGCGYELDRWIQVGDTVELEVEGIGILRSPVSSKEQLQRAVKELEGKPHAPSR